MNETQIKGVILITMIVAAPWPWFLFAVGGLLPVPIIVLWALSGSSLFLTAMLLLSAGIGIVVFYLASRSIALAISRAHPAIKAYALAGVLGLIAVVSFLPLYGGGENLAVPEGKFANLYAVYSEEVGNMLCRSRGRNYVRHFGQCM